MIYDISKVNIGKINFNEISLKEDKVEKESKYPNFPKIGEMVVEVYNLEGNNIPHFHINGQGKSICIQIYDNRYFKHGKHKDTFTNSKQEKYLDSWLRQRNSKYNNGKSNWEIIRDMWESFTKFRLDIPQPDYTTIKPYKG